MTESIYHNGDLLALIIPATHASHGSEFFTPPTFSLQVGLLKQPQGYSVPAHYHRLQERQISTYQEVLVVRKGSVRVYLYDTQNELVATRTLVLGDCILLASGGHGVEIIQDAEILEIKQGPFLGNNDKVFIETNSK